MSRELLISDPWRDKRYSSILLVYSIGFHFEDTARLIKATFPEAKLTAAVPPSVAERARACPAIDEIVLVDKEKYRPVRDAVAIVKLVMRLRSVRYDLAVSMFRSVKLGLLLYSLRAGTTAVAEISGNLFPWRVGPLRGAANALMTAVKCAVGSVIYVIVRLTLRVWRLTAS